MTANTSAGTLTHDDRIWLGTGQFAHLAGISPRVARRIMARAADGATWRGRRLVVRKARVTGGASSKRYEVLPASLPPELQAKWQRQQPMSELQEKIAEHAAEIEEERGSKPRGKGWRANSEPWTQEEREARHAAFSRLPTSIQEEATRRHPAVRLFHELAGAQPSQMLRYGIVAKEFGESCSTIRRWVRACRGLDPGDRLVALAPGYGLNELDREDPISPEAWACIDTEYFQLTKPALKPIWRRAQRIAPERGWSVPSYATVKRMIDREPHWKHVRLREGKEAFDRLYRTQNRDYSSVDINQIWVGDGRRADIFCVFADGTVARPIGVFMQDVRTRVIVGYAIGKTESADLVRAASKNAAENSKALPISVLFDNGMGFASKMLSGSAPRRFRFKVKDEELLGIFPLIGIKVIWANPYSGRSKPVESFFRHIAEAEKRFHGAYVGNRTGARPEDFDIKNAVPIATYRALIDETLALYHTTPHRGHAIGGRTPHQVYEELIRNTPVRSPTREQLRLLMMAAQTIKLDPRDNSLRILGNRYWAPELANLSPRKLYTARFDPENAAEPITLYECGRFICDVPLLHRTGFRDQQAGKDHARAKAQFKRALKDQLRATAAARKASSWLAAPGVGEDPDPIAGQVAAVLLPPPTIPQLVIPQGNIRPAEKEPPAISLEEAQAADTAYWNERKKRGNQ